MTQHGYPYQPYPPPRPVRGGLPAWGWVLIAFAGVGFFLCAGGLAVLFYIGSVAPDTRVYAGHEVPQRFMDTISELSLIDADEQIRFFYSDALFDIREGFYFVSNRKVVVYRKDAATPAVIVPFAQIESAELDRDESFFFDSTITLTLRDGDIVWFPVSSEEGRDRHFFNAIDSSISARLPR